MDDDKRYLSGTRYLIEKKLGDGATGSVYLAHDTTKDAGDDLCAIKELSPRTYSPLARREFSERFRDEEMYLRALDGFNGQIPKLYNFFSERDGDGRETHYIVQEYVEGRMLSERLKDGRLDEMEVRDFLVKLLPVLAHIHLKGFVHRDIDPSNIILRDPEGQPVLIDFGAVKELETTIVASENVNSYTIVIGKEGYMAPEHRRGRPVFASDLYSLGITAIELLTGLKPSEFRRDSPGGRLSWRRDATRVSDDFAAVLDRAVAADVKERYDGDARRMLFAIETLGIPEEEQLKRMLGDAWTSLARRQPRPSAGYGICTSRPYLDSDASTGTKADSGAAQKQRSDKPTPACQFYPSVDDEFCPNCGGYNVRRLDRADGRLLRASPESDDFRDGDSVRDYTNWLMAFGAVASAVAVWLGDKMMTAAASWWKSMFVSENVYFAAVYLALTAVFGLSSGRWIGIYVYNKQLDRAHRRKLAETRLRKKKLVARLREATAKHLEAASCLVDVEDRIASEVGDIARQRERIEARLTSMGSAEADIVGTEELLRQREELSRALERGREQQKKYGIKQTEVKLVRRHNLLQSLRGRQGGKRHNGGVLEDELKDLNAILDDVLSELKRCEVMNSDVGKVWFARLWRASDMLLQARGLTFTYMNMLAVDEGAAPPEELSRKLDALNAYITYEDFYREYKALRAE